MARKEELAALWQGHTEYTIKVRLDLQIWVSEQPFLVCRLTKFLSEDKNKGSKPAAICDQDLRASETFTSSQAFTIVPGCQSELDGNTLLLRCHDDV